MCALSTAAGTLALLVIGSLGRKVGGLRLALMSLLVGGLSGYALYYAQETRPYPLMSLMEIYRLEDWKERTLAGLELGLKGHVGEPAVTALDAPKRHIGELSMENELLRERARAAECRLPLPTRRSRR